MRQGQQLYEDNSSFHCGFFVVNNNHKKVVVLEKTEMRFLTTLICLMSSLAFQIVSPEVRPEFGNAIYYFLLKVCFSSSNPPVSS